MNAIGAWVCFSLLVRAYFPNLPTRLVPHDVRISEGGGGGGGCEKRVVGGTVQNRLSTFICFFYTQQVQ